MRTMIAMTAMALLIGCAPGQRQTANRVALAEAWPIGHPVSCVATSAIDHTLVRDSRTIDFYMTGRKVYRNQLQNICPSLGFEESFSYSTSISRLCSVDLITVLNTSGIRGPTCGLGQFQEIEISSR